MKELRLHEDSQAQDPIRQTFHEEEPKFPSLQSPKTRANQVWMENEEPRERYKSQDKKSPELSIRSVGSQPIGQPH